MAKVEKQKDVGNYPDDTSMHIALDYDDTYTRNPDMWDKIIKKMRKAGCTVCIVSDRGNDASDMVKAHLEDRVDAFYFTDGEAKKPWMLNKGLKTDIWIDDCPENILYDKDKSEDGTGDGPYETDCM